MWLLNCVADGFLCLLCAELWGLVLDLLILVSFGWVFWLFLEICDFDDL